MIEFASTGANVHFNLKISSKADNVYVVHNIVMIADRPHKAV